MNSSSGINETTGEGVEWKHSLHLFHKVLLTVGLLIIMTAMGAVTDVKLLWRRFRRPSGIATGAFCQFVAMPLVGFALAHSFKLETPEALGLFVIACSPGGGLSNMFTYWAEGDVPLSISMTCVSTVLALGMMPLNIFIYINAWSATISQQQNETDYGNRTTDLASMDADLSVQTIPYKTIFTSLLSIIPPIMLGMFIRHKSLPLAKIIIKIGSICTFLLIACAMIIQGILYQWWSISSVSVWLAPACLSLIGFIAGYLISSCFCMEHILRRTVAVETGFQNVPLALSMVALAFGEHIQKRIIVVPLVYSIFLPVNGILFVLLCRIYLKYNKDHQLNQRNGHTKNITEKQAVATVASNDSFQMRFFSNPAYSTDKPDRSEPQKVTATPVDSSVLSSQII